MENNHLELTSVVTTRDKDVCVTPDTRRNHSGELVSKKLEGPSRNIRRHLGYEYLRKATISGQTKREQPGRGLVWSRQRCRHKAGGERGPAGPNIVSGRRRS